MDYKKSMTGKVEAKVSVVKPKRENHKNSCFKMNRYFLTIYWAVKKPAQKNLEFYNTKTGVSLEEYWDR